MNVALPLKIDKAGFYDFIQRQAEGRFEFERGRIVQQMTGGTFDHARLVQRFVLALSKQLDPAIWEVTGQNRGVETIETVRYPDVIVEAIGGAAKGLSTEAPVLIVEVLSRTTRELDLNIKPVEYLSLASLQAYIVASQDDAACSVWLRGADGSFSGQLMEVAGRESRIAVEALSVSISLAEVYSGIALE